MGLLPMNYKPLKLLYVYFFLNSMIRKAVFTSIWGIFHLRNEGREIMAQIILHLSTAVNVSS